VCLLGLEGIVDLVFRTSKKKGFVGKRIFDLGLNRISPQSMNEAHEQWKRGEREREGGKTIFITQNTQ
jgi:hypothetical protein